MWRVCYLTNEAKAIKSIGVEAYLNEQKNWGDIARKNKRVGLDWLNKILKYLLGEKGKFETQCIKVNTSGQNLLKRDER